MEQVASCMHERTRLAVFDAITSNTGVRLPFEELVALCNKR